MNKDQEPSVPKGDTLNCVHAEVQLKGVPLSPGIAVGRTCFYLRQVPEPDPACGTDPQREAFRLRQALQWLGRQLEALAYGAEAKFGEDAAAICHAQRLMTTDESFEQHLIHAIEKMGYTAEEAVETQLNLYKAQIGASDTEYAKQRASDVREIQQALQDHLNHMVPFRRCKDVIYCGVKHCCLGNDHIVVVKELTASLSIETDSHTVGFIVESGSQDAPAVNLARTLRRPVVGNIRKSSTTIPLEAQIMINGDTGEVILNPSANLGLLPYNSV